MLGLAGVAAMVSEAGGRLVVGEHLSPDVPLAYHAAAVPPRRPSARAGAPAAAASGTADNSVSSQDIASLQAGLQESLERAKQRKEDYSRLSQAIKGCESEVEDVAFGISKQVSTLPQQYYCWRAETFSLRPTQIREIFEAQLQALKERQHELLLQVNRLRRCFQ